MAAKAAEYIIEIYYILKYIESNFEKKNISCKLFLGIDAI